MLTIVQVFHGIVHGPHHILTQLRLVRQQPEVVRQVVSPYISTGAWFAHPEAVLLTLVCSSDREDRVFGVKQILDKRGVEDFGDTGVRARRTPDLNFSASSVKDLISWDKDVHEPIFTCSLSKKEILELEETALSAPNFPLHSQGCERAVKQVGSWSLIYRVVL